MAYNFKFEKVEELYVQNKDRIKNDLSRHMFILNNQYDVLNNLKLRELDLSDSFGKLCENEISPLSMQCFYESIYVNNENIKNQLNNINKTENKIEKIRKELIKANQDIQIMDKLDEKYRYEYNTAENKKILTEIETYVVNRYNSKVI